MRDKPKKFLILFFLILGCVEIFSVSAYGSVMGFERNNTLWLRDSTRALIAIAGVAGLLLLPRKDRFLPRMSPTVMVCFGYLLLWGLFMVLNAQSDHIYRHFRWQIIPDEERLIPSLPGTYVITASIGYLLELGAIILFLLMLARSVESRAWQGIVKSFAICTIFVALVGLGHKVMGIGTVWGIPDDTSPETFFAPYLYNANAAAFLNLGVTVTCAIALRTQREKGVEAEFFGWLLGLGLIVGGIIAAASKAGAIILVFQLTVFFIAEFRTLRAAWQQRKQGRPLSTEKLAVLGAVSLIFLALGALSVNYLVVRFGEFFDDIEETGSAGTITGRVAMIKLTSERVFDPHDPPWAGFGAGSFRHLIAYMIRPHHTEVLATGRPWVDTHCDPLQTIFEWGYLGALCWFVFGIGAVFRGCYLIFTHRLPEGTEGLVKAMVISLIGVGIHSCFDYPLSVLSIHLVAVSFAGLIWFLGRDHCESVDLD